MSVTSAARTSDNEAIAAATKQLDEDVRLIRELKLGDAAYEAAMRRWLKVIRGGSTWIDAPRDRKAINDARLSLSLATAQHARIEFSEIIRDGTEKAILFRLMNGEKVWVPRSQIHKIDEAELMILVSRWWVSKNAHILR